MKIAIAQIKPKLCLNKEEFYFAIENIIESITQEHNPDLILLPESLGLWMSMMKPVSLLSKVANWFLPSHDMLAYQISTSNIEEYDLNDSYEIMAQLQFSRYTKRKNIYISNINQRTLLDWEEYSESIGFSTKSNFRNWIIKISNWVFNHINLSFVGRFLKSKEQFKIYKETFSSVAKKHQVAIQAGSVFVQRNFNGIQNIAYTFNKFGEIISQQPKIHPISFENMIGILPGQGEDVFEIDGVKCGVAICVDVNFPHDHVHNLKKHGCKIIACPSGGLVPSHAWKWNFETEVKNAHWVRSQEEDVIIARPYNVGDLIPNILMFQGRSSATAPREMTENNDGVLYLVSQEDLIQEHIFCIDVV
jgi:predicted amidohydrolase